jgi:hypothetical protein
MIDASKIITAEMKAEKDKASALASAQVARQSAYTAEADPLFFKWQAGEGTEAEWLAKREEIRNRFPYPTDAPD